ncbi:MAG: class I tRNA ligase family protein, partial [Chloroflexota bacterium]|nr:class I tRNA ligase family protein [Chloroflexota bacterium]
KPGEKAFFTTFPFQLLVGQSSRTREAALDTATATRTASAPQMASAPQVEMGPNELLIATTRPELLAACVAVFVHPTDARYRDVVGKTARTPIFDLEVPVLADPRADPEKGTGAVMCCTFGDVADVAWWRDHKLPLRLAITEDGHMNDSAGPYAGLTVRAARVRILEDLRATGLIREQIQIEHTVGVHDRGGHDLEYLVTKQWFVKLLEHKERWLEAGRQIRWHPEHMRTRYENWIEGLSWDWNISRQKTYGVAFPVWYCCACGAPVLAAEAQLPVDPQETPPPLDACPACGGKEFDPDTDVMDTWATSSVTPQICATLLEPLGISAPEFEQRFRPMSLRPNAHDIIRTWDFYTIVRSLYHSGGIPWTDVLISGHALDPSRKKISKSKLQVAEDPFPMLEQFSADAVRYWAASVRTAGDTALSEDVFRNGNKLVTKLWHASKFALSHLTPGETAPEAVVNGAALNATDRWLLARLHEVIRRATTAMEEYEFATAKAEVERFFWMDLCDNYLELIKLRIYGDAPAANGRNGDVPTTAPAANGRNGDARTGDGSGAAGARYVLSQAVPAVLKLLAPFMPHITEAIFMSGFAASAGVPSIHVSRWPDAPADWDRPAARQSGAVILEVVETVRRWKAARQLSVGARVGTLRISCPAAQWDALSSARLDLQGVAQAQAVDIVAATDDSPLHVSVQEAQPEPVRAGA